MAQHPILIIGAGIAGLVLAQGLRRRSVPFRLFERHSQLHRAQGHRFRISKEAQAEIVSILSPQLQHLFKASAPTRNHFEPRYVDATRLDYPEPTPASGESMPIDRAWIRSLMMLDIDDAIEFEKEFVYYEVRSDCVEVQFSDGSTTRGRLVVGADGVKSRVRKQLQPSRKLLDLERWIIWGRTPLTDSLAKTIPEDLLSWCMYRDHEANVQTVVEPIIWPESRDSELVPQLPHLSNYIYWVTCVAPLQYSASLPKTIDEKKQMIDRLSDSWHPALKHLLTEASLELSACTQIISSKPNIEMPVRNSGESVTLIGDSGHAMSPMGGSGADTAIRNAVDLAHTIAEDGVTEASLFDFKRRMAARAKEKIEHSFRGGQKFWQGKEWTQYREIDL